MATRSINRLYDRALSEVGVRVTGYSILSRLAEEGPLSTSQLAVRLAMERTTCTREVAPLVDAGLVERATGPDRRVQMLRLTELGARKHAEAYPLWKEVQRRLAEDFGDTDTVALLARLRRLQASGDRLSIADPRTPPNRGAETVPPQSTASSRVHPPTPSNEEGGHPHRRRP